MYIGAKRTIAKPDLFLPAGEKTGRHLSVESITVSFAGDVLFVTDTSELVPSTFSSVD
jgi:hypothetical protein